MEMSQGPRPGMMLAPRIKGKDSRAQAATWMMAAAVAAMWKAVTPVATGEAGATLAAAVIGAAEAATGAVGGAILAAAVAIGSSPTKPLAA
jgi:hypothetical protein